jgi:hypothetical protein
VEREAGRFAYTEFLKKDALPVLPA